MTIGMHRPRQKQNSHQPNHHETNQPICPEQIINLHRKLTHSQQTHHNSYDTVSSTTAYYRENYRPTHNMETHTTTTIPQRHQYGSNKPPRASTYIDRHGKTRVTNARNRLTNNDKQIENDIHGIPYPFTNARFYSYRQRIKALSAVNNPIVKVDAPHILDNCKF